MKPKTIYLLALLLCVVTACKKDTTTTPQSEPVQKYLEKVLILGSGDAFYEVERCTWDSLHRLKTYWSGAHSYVFDAEFYYDSIGRVAQMYYNAFIGTHRCLHFIFDWKNEKELNGINIHMQDIMFDTIYYNSIQDTYFYDELGRNIEIERHLTNSGTNITYQIEWDDMNITSAKSGFAVFVDNQKFDDKHTPWSSFPNIFIVGLIADMNSILLYNPSKNNPVIPNYDYEYDEDGYLLRQYYLKEDGTRELMYIFEYL